MNISPGIHCPRHDHDPKKRYILFAGHHALALQGEGLLPGAQPLPSFNPLTGKNELNGTSIVDVSDPRHPKYLFHLPVSNGVNGGAQMVRVCDGSSLPIHNNKIYMLRSYANSAHEIWDVTNPSNPVAVRTVAGGNPCHRSANRSPGSARRNPQELVGMRHRDRLHCRQARQ